jgi:hypothetical protein
MKLVVHKGGVHQMKGLPGCSPLTHHPKPKFKKSNFVDIKIATVLRDFPFSRNQPLKSADDQYIRIWKNKLIKLKKTRT